MAESWRNTDAVEFGNAIQLRTGTCEAFLHALTVLHRDAAKTLPPGTRYDVRVSAEISFGAGGIAWYSHSKMAQEPTWNGYGQREGYYLVGQYVTPEAT